uniref:uncharacterized protein LOC120347678 isoform X1 n=1 Tax=Styela clava TaxID=7725 RepID=UPI0019396996|nr:uncharacterized protein LOC120347678 isoform X1 [Styela clava]
MASSCGPFHAEALRRQRVIDRKRAALARLAVLQEEEEENRRLQTIAYEQAKQERHAAKMRELQDHLNDVRDGVSHKPSAGNFSRVATHPDLVNKHREYVRPATVMGMPRSAYNDIKGKEKILRNHNLYQAHPKVLWNLRPKSHR